MATNVIIILKADAPDTFPVSTGVFADFAGSAESSRTIEIAAGAGAENLDSGVNVRINGNSSDFDYLRDGSTLQIIDSEGNITAELLASPNTSSQVTFDDGATEVAVEGSQISFGGQLFDPGDEIDGATTPLVFGNEIEGTQSLDELGGTVTGAAEEFDASTDSFIFTDSVDTPNNVEIFGFGNDDQISLQGVTQDDVSFQESDGNTQFDFDDGSGSVSRITLIDVTTGAFGIDGFNDSPDFGDVVFA
ncbi:hypothetical protein PCC7418_0069 [Halothece sp. PCC 7418]|uniref:hypothetical protein n=1 Tax=Halothece sp. (strain PCC 7418) TaxID=65093 RepID=UPI0002A07C21|nr:hypothetical protein [Halothece sp. PCC 7418]AFZ42318.1 hypothetical protein PCC7418_0069 [Halothece sp. PCC 7418]